MWRSAAYIRIAAIGVPRKGSMTVNTDFEDPDIELERELAAVDVLVEGVTIVVGRRDADETDDLRSDRRGDVFVEHVQRVGQAPARVFAVLPELTGVHVVTDPVDLCTLGSRRDATASLAARQAGGQSADDDGIGDLPCLASWTRLDADIRATLPRKALRSGMGRRSAAGHRRRLTFGPRPWSQGLAR